MKFNLKNYTIYGLISALAEAYPQKTAVSYIGEAGITYEDLFINIKQAAEYLYLNGVRKKDRILIFARASENWCIYFFASVFIGAVPVVINHAVSPLILRELYGYVTSKFAFIDDDLINIISELRIMNRKTIFNISEKVYEKDLSAVKNDHIEKLFTEVEKDDLACYFLSAGTTGLPKICAFTNYNIISSVDNIPDNYHFFNENTKCLNLLSPAHIQGFMLGILSVFYSGGTVYLSRHYSTRKKLFEDITKLKPTLFIAHNEFYDNIYKTRIVPILTGQMIHHSISRVLFTRKYLYRRIAQKIAKILGREIECLFSVGARLDPELELFFLESNLPFAYGYTIAECASVITMQFSEHYKKGSSGSPLEEEKIKIVDPDEETGIGKIAFSSPALFCGYKRKVGLSRNQRGKEYWFVTSDRGFISRNGELYITGREETGIKLLNGVTLYPEEIEDLFREEHYIKEVRVKLDHDVLIAEVYPDYTYISQRLDSGQSGNAEEIDGHVLAVVNRLKEHINIKIPSIFHITRIKIRREPFEKNPYGSVLV